MIKYIVAFIVFLLSQRMIQYYNNQEPNQYNNKNGLNFLQDFVDISKYSNILADHPKITEPTPDEIKSRYYKRQAEIEAFKNLLVEKLEQGGCRKELVIKNFELRKLFNCNHGVLHKIDYKHGLILDALDLDDLVHSCKLIATIGLKNKKMILNEYMDKKTMEVTMRLKISGWEDLKKYLNGSRVEQENRSYFNELIGLNIVRKIKSITYPDFSVLNDTENEYILVTYISYDEDDRKAWIINHKLEKSK